MPVSLAIVVFFSAAMYLPGIFTLPVVDRDEARYAVASRQMVESRDYLTPRFLSSERFKKPIGIYWIQAATVSLIGRGNSNSIWIYRLPSVVGAILAVGGTFWLGQLLFDGAAAFFSAAIFSCCSLLVFESNLATTDCVLLACTLGVFCPLAAAYVGYKRDSDSSISVAECLVFWVALGLGMLVKGPVLPAIAALTIISILIWEHLAGITNPARWLRSLRWPIGIPLLVVIVAPWLVAISISSKGTFFRSMVAGDILPKLFGGQESHGAPPGYYLLAALVCFWPGSILLAPSIRRAITNRSSAEFTFLLLWLVPSWALFELIPTKLPHYVLPMYPALALIAGSLLSESAEAIEIRGANRANVIAWVFVTLLLGAATFGAPLVISGRFLFSGAGVFVAACITAWLVPRMLRRDKPFGAAAILAAGSFAVLVPLRTIVLPNVDELWPSRSAAAAIVSAHGSSSRPLALVGYEEPSAVFFAGPDTETLDPASAAALMAATPDTLVLISADARPFLDAACTQRGIRLRQLWTGNGLNYSKGRWVTLELVERARGSS